MRSLLSSRRARIRVLTIALGTLAALTLAACGSSGAASTGTGAAEHSTQVVLLTHDSFAVSKSVLADFTKQTGIKVKILQEGDAGEVVNKAILTKQRPLADAIFGLDNTFLTRAVSAGILAPYQSPELTNVEQEYVDASTPDVTPIDHSDVCVVYDKAGLAKAHVPVPTSLADLATPAYKNMLVVENPATSSPGLAFLLATEAQYGANWQQYWQQLKANGVQSVDDWDTAYYGDFSGGSGSEGTRPLVVSYNTDPAAEVLASSKPTNVSPVGVVDSTCFGQIEYAGVLAGAAHPDAAQKLIDFMLSNEFQNDMPGQMYVLPVVKGLVLPPAFAEFAVNPSNPLSVPPQEIAANRDTWIQQWTALFQS